MIVCHCFAVSSRDINRAIDRGATTLAEVSRCTGAGRGCGACRVDVEAMIAARTRGETPDTPFFRVAAAAAV